MSKLSNLIAFSRSPVFKSVGIYTFTNFFTRSISFLLLFVFTNPVYITPSENGLISLFSNSMLLLMPFLSMGIVHSTSADFFKLDKQEFRNFFTTGFVLPVSIAVLSFVVLFVFRDELARAYGFPLMFTWIIPLVTLFTFCNEQMLSLTRSNNEPMIYFRSNMYKVALELGLSLILVVIFAWRWQGRIAGILVAYSFIAAYGFWYFIRKRYLFGKIEMKYIRSELIYAVPIISLQVALFSLYASDKFFLSNLVNDNNETVGIFSIASIFAAIVFTLCNALLQYLFPRIYAILAAEEKNYAYIRKLFMFYMITMAAGTLVVIIAMPVLYHYFINAKYHPALDYAYLLCIGYFLWAIAYFFFSFLLYYKQKRKILAFSIVSIVISLFSNYFFISNWHAAGAAYSVCLCYLIILIMTVIINRNEVRKMFFEKRQITAL